MKNKILLSSFILIFVITISCDNKTKKVENKNETSQSSYITDDKKHTSWSANKTNNNNDNQRVVFFKDSLSLYFRDGSCSHNFKTQQINSTKFYQLWSTKNNCEFRKNIFEELNNLNSFPKEGDQFAEYTFVNDSTFQVNYKFPDWVKEINKIAKDSIFPKFLYLVKE